MGGFANTPLNVPPNSLAMMQAPLQVGQPQGNPFLQGLGRLGQSLQAQYGSPMQGLGQAPQQGMLGGANPLQSAPQAGGLAYLAKLGQGLQGMNKPVAGGQQGQGLNNQQAQNVMKGFQTAMKHILNNPGANHTQLITDAYANANPGTQPTDM